MKEVKICPERLAPNAGNRIFMWIKLMQEKVCAVHVAVLHMNRPQITEKGISARYAKNLP